MTSETEDDIAVIEEILEDIGLGLTYDDAPEWLVTLARMISVRRRNQEE